MTIDEAKAILESHGYEVLPMPQLEYLATVFGPDHLWMNTEPHGVDYDAISEADVLQMAEAFRDNQRCYVCDEPAVSRCPDCDQWTCLIDRRDLSPKFDDHMCALCLQRHNRAVLAALACKEEQSLQ